MRRRPRKNAGGRPAYRLDTDPDRKAIVCAIALWPWSRSSTALQLIDALFTPHASVKLRRPSGRETRALVRKFGAQLVSERVVLTVENTASPRLLGVNSAARRPTSEPGGRSFRRSRLQHLQAKVARYRRTKLHPLSLEASFFRHAMLGLMAFAAGDVVGAGLLLATIDWTLSEAEQARLVDLFRFSNNR